MSGLAFIDPKATSLLLKELHSQVESRQTQAPVPVKGATGSATGTAPPHMASSLDLSNRPVDSSSQVPFLSHQEEEGQLVPPTPSSLLCFLGLFLLPPTDAHIVFFLHRNRHNTGQWPSGLQAVQSCCGSCSTSFLKYARVFCLHVSVNCGHAVPVAEIGPLRLEL